MRVYSDLINTVSFSFSQQKQLQRLLQRYFSLAPQSMSDLSQFKEQTSAKQVLSQLTQMVERSALGESDS